MVSPESNEELLLTGHRFEVRRVTRVRRNGQRLTREIIRHPGSVVIVPCVDEHHVCLIRNQRISVDKTLIELPAGTLEPHEPPLVCARRELHEETGFRCATLRHLTTFYAAPGILDEQMHVFLADDLTADAPHREADEQIDNWIVTWAAALAMIQRGEIEDGKTIAGLLFAHATRQSWWPAS